MAATPKNSSTPAHTANSFAPSGFVRLDTGKLNAGDSDEFSSDEELYFQNDMSLSQEKMQDLSFRDTPESDCEQESLVLTLSEKLFNNLSNDEKTTMKGLGIYTIPLSTQPSPIVLGRDQFQSVFGEAIRGSDIKSLSRRHCVFYVETVPAKAPKSSIAIVVENTSTNGLEVNNRALKYGERQELQLGDVVTLLKIRNHGVSETVNPVSVDATDVLRGDVSQDDVSLSYVVSYPPKKKKTIELRPHCLPSVRPKMHLSPPESDDSERESKIKKEPLAEPMYAGLPPDAGELPSSHQEAADDATPSSTKDPRPASALLCVSCFWEELSRESVH